MTKINVTRSSMPPYEEYCDEIKDLWETRWLTNSGAKHRRFEADLKAYLNAPFATLYVNGHLALENVLAAFEFPVGGEAITTPFTFASTTHAIVRAGLTPVFCDVNPRDYTLDVDKIEALINDKTVAIVPVHVYGNLCDVDKIAEIAAKFRLKVIYDAAHAFGVERDGVSAANFGDASMFSFHATKVFHSIEGGALFCRDAALAEKLDALKNFGIYDAETVRFCGGNAKMNEFAAAMGICNLRRLDGEIAKRKVVVERYRERLQGVAGIKLVAEQANVKPNFAYFPVVFDGYKRDRDAICDELAEQGIGARKYFYPPTNGFDCYRGKPFFGTEKTPIAEYVSRRVLTLPLYADLAPDDVDRICDVVLS